MNTRFLDPGAIRALSLFIPFALVILFWVVRPPNKCEAAASLLATLWNIPALLLVNAIAVHFGWWKFQAQGGTLLGVPADLWLGWAVLWGTFPGLAFRSAPIAATVALMLAADLAYMPLLQPVLKLGPAWLLGEAFAILLCLCPAQLLARWTAQDNHLAARATLQVFCFAGIVMGVIPSVILGHAHAFRSIRHVDLWLNVLSVPVMIGLSAVQEFAEKGRGTPVPFDPPKHLVITGIYAYMRNPMQIAQSAVFLIWGMALGSLWVSAASLAAIFYSLGLALVDEQDDLQARFGSEWFAYKSQVSNWIPRWRPFRRNAARVYIASTCDICSSLGRWIEARHPVSLQIIPAEEHPTRALERMTYDAMDGMPEEQGIAALSRVLEHIHLGWALLGCAMRLPLMRQVIQIVADVSGAGPRKLERCDNYAPKRV